MDIIEIIYTEFSYFCLQKWKGNLTEAFNLTDMKVFGHKPH